MPALVRDVLSAALDGVRPSDIDAMTLLQGDPQQLLSVAGALRDRAHGRVITYSRKVFIPLTQLCRDVCHYCTFAQPPKPGQRAYLTPDEVTAIAREGAAAGCREALFTLGDKPELRYKVARQELAAMGYETTIQYLAAMSRLVFEATGLFPHANPGVMTRDEIASLRQVSVSQGIMLESVSERLMMRGGAHFGSPDKAPAARLATIRTAGELAVPFTSGILIGIGETRAERIESLLALRRLHDEYGHIQEIIVQNFRAKPGTRMADWPDPDLEDLLWTIGVARVIFGAEMNIQAPPNLSPGVYERLIGAGLNDWGGVSPVTPDHVNPEAPWPHLDALRDRTAEAGKQLAQRLPVYPTYALDSARWQDPRLAPVVLSAVDADGLARDEDWSPGRIMELPAGYAFAPATTPRSSAEEPAPIVVELVERARQGERLEVEEIAALFRARGADFEHICDAADALRLAVNGDTVTYVVNRNINYTNVCYFRCQFCAFSKGKLSENLRGDPYDLELTEVSRRTVEAWERGATEVCMQGGIHPNYTGETYLALARTVKDIVPDMHVHAFSPLEVWQGAATLGVPLREFLLQLKDAGLGTLPGTAAEVLDDDVRRVLCPDKITTSQWFEVMETAHGVGFKTTATIMYGHVDRPVNWARHLLGLRDLQARTGGFTEFVPLPFVHMEAPIFLKGRARKGPTFREAVLMHAVARLVLHPLIRNIQVSWVKMGVEGVRACLQAGCNDLGGTLMNESITRAAGTEWGQELPPERMDEIIRSIGRVPRQRTTTYGVPPGDRIEASYGTAPLLPVIQTPAPKWRRASAGAVGLIRGG